MGASSLSFRLAPAILAAAVLAALCGCSSGPNSATTNNPPPRLTVAAISLPAGTTATAYSAVCTASGGTPPYTWSISAGTLPAGLTLSASGTISGTPTGSGTSSFTIQVSDSSTPPQTASSKQSITVNPAAQPLAIGTSSLSPGVVGAPYSASLKATGGTTPYAWSISTGSLPAGLTLGASGLISGTPTASGTSSFTVKATDSSSPAQTATRALSITISSTSSISVSCVPSGGESQGGSYVNLPSCVQVNHGDLLLAVAATYPISPQGSFVTGVTDSQGDVFQPVQGARCIDVNSGSADLWYAFSSGSSSNGVNVNVQTGMQMEIATGSLPGGTTSGSYMGTLVALGGAPPYTWSIPSGSLPTGLSLNASTGVISGTAPAAATTASFTVQVTDSAGATLPQPQAFSINIVSGTPPLQINTAFLPFYMVNPETPYSTTLAASGGIPYSGSDPYTWAITSGSLPQGLSLDSKTGTISGMPVVQNYDILGTPFTVQVTDSASNTASANLTLNLPFTAGFLLQATGVDQSQPVDHVSQLSNQPASTTITSPSITTSFSEELIVAANSCQWLSSAVLTAGFTFADLGGCGAAYQVASSLGTFQVTWNQNDGGPPVSGTYCATIASFKAQ